MSLKIVQESKQVTIAQLRPIMNTRKSMFLLCFEPHGDIRSMLHATMNYAANYLIVRASRPACFFYIYRKCWGNAGARVLVQPRDDDDDGDIHITTTAAESSSVAEKQRDAFLQFRNVVTYKIVALILILLLFCFI